MSDKRHTPGPWTLQPIGDETECNILGKGRELIATVSDNDAHLIAAAPEMYEAVRTALAYVDEDEGRAGVRIRRVLESVLLKADKGV